MNRNHCRRPQEYLNTIPRLHITVIMGDRVVVIGNQVAQDHCSRMLQAVVKEEDVCAVGNDPSVPKHCSLVCGRAKEERLEVIQLSGRQKCLF